MTRQVVRMAIALSCILWSSAVFAQITGIAGVAKDASGAAMPGVTVEASSPALIEKVKNTVTDGQGLYQIVDLRPGMYTVTFTLPGFRSVKREGIELTGSFTATVNAEMSVASIEETITVSGQSPLVDTHNVVQEKVLSDELRNALPTSRSLQTMAQVIPGIIATSTSQPVGQDVGGLSGERGQIMIHGSRPQDMSLQFDGLDWNVPLGTGTSQTHTLNVGVAQEFVYELGAISSETMAGGVRANIIPKDGGNLFSGFFIGSFTGSSLQSNNLTASLVQQGLPSPNLVRYQYDVNPSFGGPIIKDKLWFYASYRNWASKFNVAGLYRPVDPLAPLYVPDTSQPAYSLQTLRNYSTRLTWQGTPRNKFSLYMAWEPFEQPFQGVSATKAAEATYSEHLLGPRTIEASWKSVLTSKLFWETAVISPVSTTNLTPIADSITPNVISITDLGTGLTYRSSPTYFEAHYTSVRGRSSVSYVTGGHVVKVGVAFDYGYVWNQNTFTEGGETYTFVNGVPRSITELLSPRDERESMRSLGLFAQDQWTLKHLTINAGVRLDSQKEWVPAQVSGPGPFVPAQTWPEVTNVPNWKDVSPRLGVAYDLFGDGKTAVKTTLSRYVVRDMTSFAAANNPMLFNATATRTWNDLNGDFIPQPNELGPLSNPAFATTATTTHVDPAISQGWGVRPYNWEFSAGVQHQLAPGVSANITYFRRWYGNFTTTANLALTPADYSPYCITDPSDARLPGGGGQQICGLYDVNKIVAPNNLNTSTNAYGTEKETFNGIDAGVNMRLPHRIQLAGGVSSGTSMNLGNATQNSIQTCYVVNSPQELRFCNQSVPWRTQYKFLGTVDLLWGVSAAATFQSIPGPEITAAYTVNSAQTQGLGRNLTAGTATIQLVQPGTMFGERLYQLDLRVSKGVHVGGLNVRAILDLANALNGSAVLLQNNTYGPKWLQPTYILPGRLISPSVQIGF